MRGLMFTSKAVPGWMDSEINMQWVAKTLAPGIGK